MRRATALVGVAFVPAEGWGQAVETAATSPAPETPFWERLAGVLGIVVLLGIAWALSKDRRRVPWRVVGWGLALQFSFALFILKTRAGLAIFQGARDVVNRILDFTTEGAHFVFGPLALNANNPDHQRFGTPLGFFFFFGVLTTIIFFASLMSILYHLGVMQRVVRGMAWVMARTMGTSGSESLVAAANVFVGQTEAPLLVRPFIATATRSEIMAIMTTGFATIAGGVLVAYVAFGIDAGHLLAASVMSAPAALVVAKLMHPETEISPTKGTVRLKVEKTTANVIDAAAVGAADGMRLAINVAAMLLAFIALIKMIDFGFGWAHERVWEAFPKDLATLFGSVFSPIAFCLGVDGADLRAVGDLLGTKIAINEFVAYAKLHDLEGTISERSFTIATYALCGFANFASIAIQIGGIGGIAPERRGDLARLGLRAMIAGALASWLTATIAGILV